MTDKDTKKHRRIQSDTEGKAAVPCFLRKAALACTLFFLSACGSQPVEERAEWGTKRQQPEEIDVREFVQSFDFSVQEYPIDEALYTAEVEQEFQTAFYEAISNRVPMEYRDDGAVYFRDYLRGVAPYSDSEFLEFVENSQYRFIDMDGDGMPELAVQFGLELCILQYDREEKSVERYFGPDERCKLLGSDRLGFFHTESAGLERYGYAFLGGSGETEQIVYFERDTMYETLCTVAVNGEVNGGAKVSEEEWEALAEDFFYVMAHPVAFVPFEEAFPQVPDREGASAADAEEARQAYEAFLAGGKNAGNVTITDIAENTAGRVEYLIHDVSGDGVPELVLQTEEKFYVLAYQEGRLFVWLAETDFYGSEGRYDVLENGEVVHSVLKEGKAHYTYWLLQPSAEIMVHFACSREDRNGDGIYDEADIYRYDARTMEERYYSMQEAADITMAEWMAYTADYLEIEENGGIRLRGALAWSVYDM